MASNNVRVIIPNNAAELILLSQDILEKHADDGAGSVLNGLDMAEMQTKTTLASSQHTLARNLNRDAETATQQRDLALGAAESFLPGTVMFYITSIRDFLLGRFRGQEQLLGDWEFEVNESAEGAVTVEIPDNAVELITLSKDILAKHAADGAGSILNQFDMADMQVKTTTAKTQNKVARKLERNAETATQKRNLALGHGKKQNSKTPGVVLFYVSSVRDTLLGIFRGREQELGDWGFTVDTSAPPAPPTLVTFFTAVTNQSALQGFNIGIRGFAGDEVSILWGDGNTSDITLDGTTQNTLHSYLTPGIYTIDIKGNHPERIIELLITHASLSNAQPADNLTALEILNLEYNPIISFIMPTALTALTYVSFFQDALNVTSINSILQTINAFNTAPAGASMLLHGGTNAAPTGQGIAAKNQLESRGWAVATN